MGRIEEVAHRVASRLLSQHGLRLVVWIATLVALAVNAATMPSVYRAVVPIALVLAVLQAATLVWALSRPWFAVLVSTTAVAGTALLTADGNGFPWPLPVVTLVTLALTVLILAVREPWPLPVVGAAAGVGAGAAAALLVHRGAWSTVGVNLATAASVLGLVVTFGILVHQWQRSRAALLEQQEIAAAALQREHLMEERNRLARELHDVVAHGLSVISIQASTVRYRVPEAPAAVLDELEEITAAARRSLGEMRGLLAVLRQEHQDDERAPQPTLRDVPALVASTRRGADAVRLRVTGDLRQPSVSAATGLGAYRIVQEALSNALRHAPGSPVDVRLTVSDRQVVVEVENGPPAGPPPSPTDGDGFGLRGMRERAAAIGGTLSAAATPAGGFAVRAVLPCRAHADEDAAAVVPPAAVAAGPDG